MTLKLLMCDKRIAVGYLTNSTEFMAHFSMLEMVAKPKHPINICDDLVNKAEKAETSLIPKEFNMFFSEKKILDILNKD